MSRPTLAFILPALTLVGTGAWGQLAALDSYIVGPRALGMGGTGVASTDDYTAQFYNPALLGILPSPSVAAHSHAAFQTGERDLRR